MIKDHQVVSHESWLDARRQLLAKEKAFTRLRDDLSRARRELPWEAVNKSYIFEGPDGKQTLSDLFGGRSQLIVYHFMFHPDWQAGCKSCSFWADNFDGIDIHLKYRDVTFIVVSRAPYEKLAAYKKRMDWNFTWVSSFGSAFNFDYNVSFKPDDIARNTTLFNYERQKPFGEEVVGISVFFKDSDGEVFHTYSTYSRGVDMMNGAYHYLDLTPRGRDEAGLDANQAWVRRHDEYD
jgi:predicted dithiol-disulfide oxidoreductase (DUF899 family)